MFPLPPCLPDPILLPSLLTQLYIHPSPLCLLLSQKPKPKQTKVQ